MTSDFDSSPILPPAATAAFAYWSKLNPLWALGAAAALGFAGFV
jgi:hypothetical protein